MSEADDIRKRLELAKSRRAAAAAAAAAAASASSASNASLPTAPTTTSTTAASLPPSALVPAVTAAATIANDETTTTAATTSRRHPVSGEDPLAPPETNQQQQGAMATTASSSSSSATEQRVMVALCSGSRTQDPPHANQATTTQPEAIVIAASSSSVSSAISSSTTTTRRPTVVLPSIPLPFPTTPDPNVKPDYHSWNGHHFVTGASFVSAMVGSHLRFSSNNSDSRRRDAAEEDDAATLALLQHHDIRDVLSSSRKRGRADDSSSSSGQQSANKKLGIDSLSGFVNPAVSSPPPAAPAASAPPSSSASPLAVPYPRVDTLNPVSSSSTASNNNRTVQQDGAPRCHPTRDVESYFTPNGKLSEGVYGVVIRAQENDTGDLAALKQLKSQWFQESQIGFPHFLLREVDVALRLHHPNLAHTKEVLCRVADPGVVVVANNDDAEHKKSVPRYDASPKTFPLAYVTGAVHQRFFPISASSSSSSLGTTSDNHRPATTTTTAPLSIYLSMEYCWKDLKGFLYDTHRNPLLHLSHRNIHPDAPRVYVKKAKCIAKQIFEGLAFLHAHNILHRDLKTSNVLVDATGVVKLCDFGLARFVQRAECLTPTVVTLMYRAPELHLGVVDYDQKMDVWAAGCILAELFLKYPVFHAEDEMAHLERVCEVIGLPDGTAATFPGLFWRQGMAEKLQALTTRNVENRLARLFQPPDDEEMTVAGSPQRGAAAAVATTTAAARRRLYRGAHTLPPEGLDLLLQIFQWNPKNRPSAAEVLRHPFFSPESDTAPCSPAELMKPTPFQPSPQTSTLHKSGQDAIALSSPRITSSSTTTTTTLMTAAAARLAAETILEQEVFLMTPVHLVVAGSPTTTAAASPAVATTTTTFANVVGEQKLSSSSPSGGDSKTKGEGATSAGQVGVDGVVVAEADEDDDDEDEDDRQEQEALRALFGASPTSVGGAAAERELKMRLVMHDDSSPEDGVHNEDQEKGKDRQERSANQAEDVVS